MWKRRGSTRQRSDATLPDGSFGFQKIVFFVTTWFFVFNLFKSKISFQSSCVGTDNWWLLSSSFLNLCDCNTKLQCSEPEVMWPFQTPDGADDLCLAPSGGFMPDVCCTRWHPVPFYIQSDLVCRVKVLMSRLFQPHPWPDVTHLISRKTLLPPLLSHHGLCFCPLATKTFSCVCSASHFQSPQLVFVVSRQICSQPISFSFGLFGEENRKR